MKQEQEQTERDLECLANLEGSQGYLVVGAERIKRVRLARRVNPSATRDAAKFNIYH